MKSDLFTSIFEALKMELIGDDLFNYVSVKTGCTLDEFERAYSKIIEAYLG